MSKRLLELKSLTMEFGGVVALNEVDLHVNEGEIMGLIGPNGAGKTTVFNVVTGVFKQTSGEMIFDGQPLAARKPHQITRKGIARTFQNIRLFPGMTAVENVIVGADAKIRTSVVGAMLKGPRARREEKAVRREAYELLEFVGISDRANELATNLSYGQQRRLEIARALATKPKLLLLDEPAAGFNPSEKRELLDLISQVRDRGFTVLLIEHDMGLVMNICDRVAVLEFGKKIADASPAEVQNDQRVIDAYLGVAADA